MALEAVVALQAGDLRPENFYTNLVDLELYVFVVLWRTF
jgi:hypothetical protein